MKNTGLHFLEEWEISRKLSFFVSSKSNIPCPIACVSISDSVCVSTLMSLFLFIFMSTWTTLGYFCSLKTIVPLLWYTFLFIAKFHMVFFVLGIRKPLWVPLWAELNTQSYRLRCCLGCFSLAVKRHCDQSNLEKRTWVWVSQFQRVRVQCHGQECGSRQADRMLA